MTTQPTREHPDWEATRDPIYLLQSRRWHCHNHDAYTYEDEHVTDMDGTDVDDAYMRDHDDDWSDYWHVEGVWFTRAEAERFGKQTHYRYPHGHRVYCVCADGELAALLRSIARRRTTALSEVIISSSVLTRCVVASLGAVLTLTSSTPLR